MVKTEEAPSPLDKILNSEVITGSIARFREISAVVELAHESTKNFRELAGYLQESARLASSDNLYKQSVADYISRDCFLLTYRDDACDFSVNQLQARLQLEGLKNKAYLSVRNELLNARQEYQTALQQLKSLFESA